jgi:hypothetical protein
MTLVMPSIVTLVSAIFVEMTTLVLKRGALSNTRSCSSFPRREYRGMT